MIFLSSISLLKITTARQECKQERASKSCLQASRQFYVAYANTNLLQYAKQLKGSVSVALLADSNAFLNNPFWNQSVLLFKRHAYFLLESFEEFEFRRLEKYVQADQILPHWASYIFCENDEASSILKKSRYILLHKIDNYRRDIIIRRNIKQMPKTQVSLQSDFKIKTKSSNAQNPKQVDFQQLKQQFLLIAENLDKQNKTNTLLYRDKYYELVQAVICMFSETNASYQIIQKLISTPGGDNDAKTQEENCRQKSRKSVKEQEKNKKVQKIQVFPPEPMLMVDYCQKFMKRMQEHFLTLNDREQKLRKQMLEMFTMSSNHNFLETLALKNLETHKLVCATDEMQLEVDQLTHHNNFLQETVNSYTIKFQQMQSDYYEIITSVAEMLKKCENNQIQLRQQNRLQGELIQSHKIEFQRYKSNFKLKSGLPQKEAKLRKIMHKQYEQQFKVATKQIEHMIKNRYVSARKDCLKVTIDP